MVRRRQPSPQVRCFRAVGEQVCGLGLNGVAAALQLLLQMNDARGGRGAPGLAQGGGELIGAGAKFGHRLAQCAQLVQLRPGGLVGMLVPVSGASFQGCEAGFAATPQMREHLRAPSLGAIQIEFRLFLGGAGFVKHLHRFGGARRRAEPRFAHRGVVGAAALGGQAQGGGGRRRRVFKQGTEQVPVFQQGDGRQAHTLIGIVAGAFGEPLLLGGGLLRRQRVECFKPSFRLGGGKAVAGRKQA